MARSEKAARTELRERLRRDGWSVRQIAAEMQAQYRDRPRRAWRAALGWTQVRAAMEFQSANPGVAVDEARLSRWENWPHSRGARPSLEDLTRLAQTFGHDCTVTDLLDDADREHLPQVQRDLLAMLVAAAGGETPAEVLAPGAYGGPRPSVVLEYRPGGRLVGPAPSREEVTMAADESAQFQRWSAATNVDGGVLEQMRDDVGDLARAYLVDPPAVVFARTVGLRNAAFRLLTTGRQRPVHTTELYRVAGAACALLAHAAADLSEPHAAMTQARAALHCAEMIDYRPLRVYTRWVQSNVAYWDGRYGEAARLVEAALPEASSGSGMLRLRSQQARIAAARGDRAGVTRALLEADRARQDGAVDDEPGVFAFPRGKAAYYASEAYRETGALPEAVTWAQTAVELFSAEPRPSTQLVAAARMDLARAHITSGQVAAAGEHLAPVLTSTDSEHRTVPVLSRARTLRGLLAGHDSVEAVDVRAELDAFCAAPALAPPEVATDNPPAID